MTNSNPPQGDTSKDQAKENTDVEIWRKPLPKGESEGMSYYQPSISVTKTGLIQIHVGGLVIGMPVEEWHNLAAQPKSSKQGDTTAVSGEQS